MRQNDIKRNVPIKWLYSDNLWQFGDNDMTKLDETHYHKKPFKKLNENLKSSRLESDWIREGSNFYLQYVTYKLYDMIDDILYNILYIRHHVFLRIKVGAL